MSRSTATDMQLRWECFLIDGFEDWLPLATIASFQLPKSKPREILASMITDWYFPEGIQQSTDDISDYLRGWAMRMGAVERDPKTGAILGRMDRNQRKPVPPLKPSDDPVRRKKAERRAREAQLKGDAGDERTSED